MFERPPQHLNKRLAANDRDGVQGHVCDDLRPDPEQSSFLAGEAASGQAFKGIKKRVVLAGLTC
jgi:hypothetical protein